MSLVRKLLKHGLERNVARVFGRLLWPPVSAVVMADGDHEDILTLRVDDRHELPGGIVNFGEDPKQAAEREAKEETGFDVEVLDLLDVRVNDINGSIMFFFHGKVTGGEASGSWEGEPEFVEKEVIEDKVWRLEHSHIHEYLFPERSDSSVEKIL